MGNTVSQIFPPKPGFTEKDLPDLKGKVYVVTGSNTGVGLELAAMLYSKNAKVYVAARSKDKSLKAIETIRGRELGSKGQLEFLPLDLADLTKIKASVGEFLAKENRLDVLFNNAGVMLGQNAGVARTAQGYELHLGTNNVGTFLFTKLLTPILVATAKREKPGHVRVVWVASTAAEALSHKPGGVPLDNLDYHTPVPTLNLYGNSKAGNYLHATEFARRHKNDRVVSVALHPGNLDSDLYRDQGSVFKFLLRHSILYPSYFGAYTELFAGLSPQVSLAKTGSWIVPWGRFMPIREDLVAASKPEAEGGSGVAQRFWKWSEDQVQQYA